MKDNNILDIEDYMNDENMDYSEKVRQAIADLMRESGVDDEKNAETAYDFLELADSAASERQALKYAKKALELEPENWDAASMVAEISTSSPEKLLEKYEQLIKQADAVMERDGYFSEDCIGNFWGIFETRPYMRMRSKYLGMLVSCSMFKKAIAEAEELLRLCANDNLGVRFSLMALYVLFEDEAKALELYSKYKEESTMFLFPLSLLYYRLGDFKQSRQYLRRLKKSNKDTFEFFEAMVCGEEEKILHKDLEFGYRPFTIDEFVAEFEEATFLLPISVGFIQWGYSKLKSMK